MFGSQIMLVVVVVQVCDFLGVAMVADVADVVRESVVVVVTVGVATVGREEAVVGDMMAGVVSAVLSDVIVTGVF